MDEGTRLHPTGAWPTPSVQDSTPGSAGLLSALPEGWVMLARCRTGTAGPASYPTGCYALAHPTTGIALVDVAPDATPNAESRLRRALGTANFWPAFPGYLPVWHGRIELAAWRSLPGIMAEGFSELPPLTVPGKSAWIAAARTALRDDPAWDVPGSAQRGLRPRPQALVPVPPDDGEHAAPAPRRPWRGRLALALGFVGTFALGLASGVVLLSGETPPVVPAASLAVMPNPAPAAASVALPAPLRETARPSPAPVATVPAPVMTAPAPAPVLAPRPAAPVVPQVPLGAEAVVAPGAATPPEEASAADATAADVPEPAEADPANLPLPPDAPKTPAQRASRPAARIDRACSQALYRFQQGLPLSAAEAAHVREGCATRR